MAKSYTRTPPPRQLGPKETLESLTHWRTSFKTFYKRDEAYKRFFKFGVVWNNEEENYGFTDDGSDYRAEDIAEDLRDLLNTLASFLPYSYLTDKILNTTTCWEDVWRIINDHYNVRTDSESLLDFEKLFKTSEETYRQYYERLLQHVKQHLAPAGVKVETKTNTVADELSISLMNMVALQWLRKIDPELIEIVKTEYSTELRENTQLAHLVPRIAPNIDCLLKRYSTGRSVNNLKIGEQEVVDANNVALNRIRKKDINTSSNYKNGNFYATDDSPLSTKAQKTKKEASRGPFCPGCFYLSKQLKAPIHFKHTPGDCPRKALAIKMFQTEDSQFFDNSEEESSEDGKKLSQIEGKPLCYPDNFQTILKKWPESQLDGDKIKNRLIQTLVEATPTLSTEAVDNLSDIKPVFISDDTMDDLKSKVASLQVRQIDWKRAGVRKSKSPCVWIEIAAALTLAVIDEGSEINCIDYSFATKNKIEFVPTRCTAYAAGSMNIQLEGETRNLIFAQVKEGNSQISLLLGKMVIVRNLGVDVLIGEPGKKDNLIVTYPHKRLVEFSSKNGKRIKIPYSMTSRLPETSHHCKAIKNEVVYPGEYLSVQLPVHSRSLSYVTITAANQDKYPWVQAKVVPVNQEGFFLIRNDANDLVKLSKHEHYATATPCAQMNGEELKKGMYVKKIYNLDRSDLSHLIPMGVEESPQENFLHEVSIDPDNVLPAAWKKRFFDVCARFSHIITPRPGKYNGFYGRIDNSINFASSPPPLIRAHLPKYNQDMLKIMGDKMDKLEEWGVLIKPEDIGVVPEFVLPSMLVPKPEKGEWRLVTDFTPLNVHIKKLETISPTISEAKRILAKYKFLIQMDLSNYFYQGGMRIEDCQYLATPHPFKGLRVYVCEPQGLKNASEHAYERLGLIYGDLCAQEKMTRMADGLFILADTLEDLEKNFTEVLLRADLCGLTLKPSKLIIAPYETIIFGWRKRGSGWSPTPHVVSPLLKANPPVTVKQGRSWVGAYKQMTECIPRYAVLLGPLEKILAGRASAEHINWTDELLQQFDKCKKSLNDLNMIFVPKPTDILHTWSDYSASEMAVGGSLEIHITEYGTSKKLLGGHFSCRVNRHQQKWYPCEGEALGVKLVLEHFSPYLRENKNQVVHHTDNQPVVQAWRRSKTGAFSSSARISAFLSGVSSLNVELVHTPGADMKSSDYNSRHPEECQDHECQICQFAFHLEKLGDAVSKISVQDIEQGIISMPFTQKAAWLKVQRKDKVHQQLDTLMKSSQVPEKKRQVETTPSSRDYTICTKKAYSNRHLMG